MAARQEAVALGVELGLVPLPVRDFLAAVRQQRHPPAHERLTARPGLGLQWREEVPTCLECVEQALLRVGEVERSHDQVGVVGVLSEQGIGALDRLGDHERVLHGRAEVVVDVEDSRQLLTRGELDAEVDVVAVSEDMSALGACRHADLR